MLTAVDDPSMRVWNAKTGALLHTFKAHTAEVSHTGGSTLHNPGTLGPIIIEEGRIALVECCSFAYH